MDVATYARATMVLGTEWVSPIIRFHVHRELQLCAEWTPESLRPKMALSSERAFDLAICLRPVRPPADDWTLERTPLPSG